MNINLGEIVADFFKKKKEKPDIAQHGTMKIIEIPKPVENKCIHHWRITDVMPTPVGKGYKVVCSECHEHKIFSQEALDEFAETFPTIFKDCRLVGHELVPTDEEIKYYGSQGYRTSCCRKCGKTILG